MPSAPAAVRVAAAGVDALDGTGSGVVPANQCRAGESHSIATLAATTLARKPPVTRPQRNSGTASTLSPSRADRFRLSTWKPRIAAAVAQTGGHHRDDVQEVEHRLEVETEVAAGRLG